MTETAVVNEGGTAASGDGDLRGLGPALRRLDRLLERAVVAAEAAYGPSAATDRFRGLHISGEDVARLLARPPGDPLLPAQGEAPEPSGATESARLAWLGRTFGLTAFEVDVVLIALAPDLDLRYERIYAYLQDDVTRRRPSVELILNLLCASSAEKLATRACFGPGSALLRHRLVRLVADPNHFEPPLLSKSVRVDEQIVAFLVADDSLDPRLASFTYRVIPGLSLADLPLAEEVEAGLRALTVSARTGAVKLHLHGPADAGQRQAAEALAFELDAPLLVADLALAPLAGTDFDHVLALLFREASFDGAVLFFDNLDALVREDRARELRRLCSALAEHPGVTLLSSRAPWRPQPGLPGREALAILSVPFDVPDATGRLQSWQTSLATNGISLPPSDLEILAGRFRLTPDQIAQAAAAARPRALWRGAAEASDRDVDVSSVQPGLGDLFTAARDQCGHDLAHLARRIEPRYGWDDIVLPEDAVAQLRELCQRVVHRKRVMEDWGFGKKLSLGKGVTALFSGASGTGKTMAAEVVATELGLDLYKINLASVVSKWIGETEKNLDRIFTAAENANAILFFDEADALFGKRSEVRDSHDRYANVEISYLLQKMEEYEGIAILATNLRANLDDAFVRRLTAVIHFPFPDEASRRRIWDRTWPASTPCDENNPEALAHQFHLNGAGIKNVALLAAFLATEHGVVTHAQLFQAVRREFQKVGKRLHETPLTADPNRARRSVPTATE